MDVASDCRPTTGPRAGRRKVVQGAPTTEAPGVQGVKQYVREDDSGANVDDPENESLESIDGSDNQESNYLRSGDGDNNPESNYLKNGNGGNENVHFIDEEEEEILAATAQVVKVKVAADSGSVANVIRPADLPPDAVVVENTSGRDFVGAGGGRIRKYGSCNTMLRGKHGPIGCGWQVADVTRALHSVAVVCGPIEAPEQDFLFCAGRGVIVPPGIVEQILKTVQPLAEYTREGNLYVAEMEMTSFTRQVEEA